MIFTAGWETNTPSVLLVWSTSLFHIQHRPAIVFEPQPVAHLLTTSCGGSRHLWIICSSLSTTRKKFHVFVQEDATFPWIFTELTWSNLVSLPTNTWNLKMAQGVFRCKWKKKRHVLQSRNFSQRKWQLYYLLARDVPKSQMLLPPNNLCLLTCFFKRWHKFDITWYVPVSKLPMLGMVIHQKILIMGKENPYYWVDFSHPLYYMGVSKNNATPKIINFL